MKYFQLKRHLESLIGDIWGVTFDELERIIGFALPASARRYPAWWANQTQGGHSQAHAWIDAGWVTREVDTREGHVTFTRVRERRKQISRTKVTRAIAADQNSKRTAAPANLTSTALRPASELPVIALVSCVKQKAAEATKAKDLYISPLFRKSRSCVERHGWRWYILSALHGLVDPERVLEPYDRTLLEASRKTRRDWAAKVLNAIDRAIPKKARIVLLAGNRYTEFLIPGLLERGHIVEQPLQGVSLGNRLRLLTNSSVPDGTSRGDPGGSGSRVEIGRALINQVPEPKLNTDLDRARSLAQRLHKAFLSSGPGIFGARHMPEDIEPAGVSVGSREHVLFLMLIVSVDYMRDASDLWRASREAWADPALRYLFEPNSVLAAGKERVGADLKNSGVSRKVTRDALAWFTISKTLAEKWDGDPCCFLDGCKRHAPTVLERLKSDKHLDGDRWRADFPSIRGPKIGPLWIRMLRDNASITLSGLDEVPIPVDVHVLRATLCSGVLWGNFTGPLPEIFPDVREIWRLATRGLTLPDGKAMVALDVDESLWTLSRLGCSKRGNGVLGPCPVNCPAEPGCVSGQIRIQNGNCEVATHVGR